MTNLVPPGRPLAAAANELIVPSLIHPRSIAPLFATDLTTGERVADPVLTRCEKALQTAHAKLSRRLEARRAIAADGTHTPAAGELKVRDLALKAGESQFNWQETDSIEWARWSWNPVTGCLHDCNYCYARDVAERFYQQKFEPTFLPERLTAPGNTKIPEAATIAVGCRNVFVCWMADLFGKWVPEDWIDAVFDQVRAHSEWNFLFLTKFPQRLAKRERPDNAWCGTTVDTQERVKIAERAFRDVKAGVKWLSVEPVMERITFTSLEMFNWIVIGGATRSTRTPAFDPPMEWVRHLLDQAQAAGIEQVYAKANLRALRGYPSGPLQ